jgi:hypothetical protein
MKEAQLDSAFPPQVLNFSLFFLGVFWPWIEAVWAMIRPCLTLASAQKGIDFLSFQARARNEDFDVLEVEVSLPVPDLSVERGDPLCSLKDDYRLAFCGVSASAST